MSVRRGVSHIHEMTEELPISASIVMRGRLWANLCCVPNDEFPISCHLSPVICSLEFFGKVACALSERYASQVPGGAVNICQREVSFREMNI